MENDELQEAMKVKKNAAGEEETDVNYRGWKTMPYVIGNETFEKLGTIGTLSNLLVYLKTVFHMESVSAAIIIQAFNGTTNLTPLLGAFLSDTYFGRYSTIASASVASLVGMLMLTLTAAITKLHPPSCSNASSPACQKASPLQLSVLFLSFLFLVIGAGGIRPCNLAFGADQFDPRTDSGRRGINSFFNWYYFGLTISIMISSTFILYVQSNVSWALGLAIPTLLMFFSCVFFFLGSKLYVKVKPEGGPLNNVARVLAAAFRKRNQKLPEEDQHHSLFDPPLPSNSLSSKLPHTDQFRCLDKASIIASQDELRPNGLPSNPWRLCSLQHVEEVKCLARIIPIWIACMIYTVPLSLQGIYVVFQALQSDRRLGGTGFQIPAGSFIIFNMLAFTAWIPLYDRLIVPRFQKATGVEGGFTLLQRIGIGIIISIAAILVSAVVEGKRRRVSSLSSLWLIPQLVLLGLSEAFCSVGQVEFYYKQFPESMRSIAGAFLLCGFAASSYLSSLVVMAVEGMTGGGGKESWLAGDLNKGRLDLFYYSSAVMASMNFVFFVICAKWYVYSSQTGGRHAFVMEEIKSSDDSSVL